MSGTSFVTDKRIALMTGCFLPVSPTLLSAIELLAEAGYYVDVIAQRPRMGSEPSFNSPNVVLHISPWNDRVVLPGMCSLRHLLLFIWVCLVRRPSVVIAVNPEFLALAGPVAVALRIPLIHYSLEVRFPTDWKSWFKKQVEKHIYCFVRFTIIQDEVRAQTLLDSNGVSDAEMILVPNSAGSLRPQASKSDYLRRRWNIPPEQTLVLCAGSIQPAMMTHELVRSAQQWPTDWTLVIHGWAVDSVYLEEVRAFCDSRRIILSEGVLPHEQLDALFSSADVGIALYKDLERNVHDMARASGKLWQYLRCGLPVVTVDFPSLQQIVDEGEFGVCVHQAEAVQGAIEQILSDYSGYAARAREYYRRYGDFAANFRPVLTKIEALCS
jgi:glycosyltransferase involved in cell wall biosynthesis